VDISIGVDGGPDIVYQKAFGPFDEKPTVALGAEFNTPPRYSTEQIVNGQYFGLAESYGRPAQFIIRKSV
jgi:hypothetical protein